ARRLGAVSGRCRVRADRRAAGAPRRTARRQVPRRLPGREARSQPPRRHEPRRALERAMRLSAVRWALAAALGAPAPAVAPPIRFEEVSAAVGAKFRHHTRTFPGPFADVLGMFTAGGSAVAVGDFDGDG